MSRWLKLAAPMILYEIGALAMITEQNIKQLKLTRAQIKLLKELYKGKVVYEGRDLAGNISDYTLCTVSATCRGGQGSPVHCNKQTFFALLMNGLIYERKIWEEPCNVKIYVINCIGAQVLKKLDVDWEL